MPFRKKCHGCGEMFVSEKRSTRFHSRSCFATWRESTPEWQSAKRRGQLKSAATGRRKSQAIYAVKASRCATTGEAFREGFRDGYRLGWKRGERVGFADGYEAATKDMRFGRTA